MQRTPRFLHGAELTATNVSPPGDVWDRSGKGWVVEVNTGARTVGVVVQALDDYCEHDGPYVFTKQAWDEFLAVVDDAFDYLEALDETPGS